MERRRDGIGGPRHIKNIKYINICTGNLIIIILFTVYSLILVVKHFGVYLLTVCTVPPKTS